MSKLTIISHTEHYKTSDGIIVGLGSTVTEINHLLEVFDEIVHVAMFYNSPAPPSALPYTSSKIKFIELPALGGPNITDKLAVIWKAPTVIKTVKAAIRKTDYFQFRAPTGIGVYVIPYLVLLSSKKGWFKYAGNWKQEQAPLAYRFQRWMLKKQKRQVTINGAWEKQRSHCLTYENPCLTEEEVAAGNEIIKIKKLKSRAISICFVGRLEEEKGIGLLISALSSLRVEEKSNIDTIHIVGDGKAKLEYQKDAENSGLNFVFHGFLSRKQVHDIYKESHGIVLPSASEGFPKVIAEAMNYGCLPIVSNISSIGHYVKDEINGFLVYPITQNELLKTMTKLFNLSEIQYTEMMQASNKQLLKFTYSYYNLRIKQDVLRTP